jgi:hypothetical protein
LLVVLGGVVALLALWLVALKPKPVAIDKTPLAPTQAIPKARKAVAAADAASAKVDAASTAAGADAAPAASAPAAAAASAAPAASAATAPAAKRAAVSTRRLDGSIVREMKQGKVVVVLFWNAAGADDVATHGAVRALGLHGGRVAVHVVAIGDVARYPSITQGVTIAQSPTTLVIGRKRRSRVIAGLSSPSELTQAVGDALAGR